MIERNPIHGTTAAAEALGIDEVKILVMFEILGGQTGIGRPDLLPKVREVAGQGRLYSWSSEAVLRAWWNQVNLLDHLVKAYASQEFPTKFLGLINSHGAVLSERDPEASRPLLPGIREAVHVWRYRADFTEEIYLDIWVDYKGRGFRIVDRQSEVDLSGPIFCRDWECIPVICASVESVLAARSQAMKSRT